MHHVIIIGAGPAGLSFACSLSTLGIDVTIIEKQAEATLAAPEYDGREIALTHSSKHTMQEMGSWQRFAEGSIGKIREAKVLDGTDPYALHFDYREVCDDTLGYIASNHLIRKAIYEEVKSRDNITLRCEVTTETFHTDNKCASVTLNTGETLYADLLIAADSRFSQTRRDMGISTKFNDFGKIAIVCKASHEDSHQDTAYECFLYGGTLAILPLVNQESSIVITMPSQEAHAMLAMPKEQFVQDVTIQFERRFGSMELIGERHSYPLVATYADTFIAERFALIGDAAVGMHPVTAHGFNLGLKGQETLACEIQKALQNGQDIASPSVLGAYNRQHRSASRGLYLGTNALVQLYTDERRIPKLVRKAVLRLGNHIAPAKRAIMHQLTEVKKTG